MRALLRWAVIGCFVVWPNCIFAADSADLLISPDWTSDRILEQWPGRDYDALVFSFRSETTAQGSAASVTIGTARLGQDFDHISTGAEDMATDYRHCRMYIWAAKESSFNNLSCYADPAYRQIKLSNQLKINAAIKDGVSSESGVVPLDHPYWLEQKFAAQHRPSDPLERTSSPQGTTWQLAGKMVAQASADGFDIQDKDRQRVMRYFARYKALHPQVRRDIIASGRIPSTLIIERRDFGGASRETLTLALSGRANGAFPLPPKRFSQIERKAKEASLEARGMRQALNALAGDAQPPRLSFKDNLDQLKKAAKSKNRLETTYVFFKLTQLHGGVLMTLPQQMDRLRKIMPKVKRLYGKGDAAQLMQASDLAGSAGESGDREAAALFLANASGHDALDFGTFRYVTFANLVRSSAGTQDWDKAIFEAMPSLTDCYWTHIAAFPWASNAYKDLGDTRLQNFEAFSAWDAWDLGRAVDVGWTMTSMAAVTNLEAQVRGAMPDSF